MGKIKKALTQNYDLPFNLSESTLSMILGGIVVILVGLIAFNFFNTQRDQAANTSPKVSITPVQVGEVGEANSAVALPYAHTVTSGESLWTIAEKYYGSGYNMIDIIEKNKLANPDVIEVGAKLTIPKVAPKAKTVLTTAPQPTITENKIQGEKYTVIAGDDLWDIALRSYGDGYRWVEIAKANKIYNPDLIHTGNILTIPRK